MPRQVVFFALVFLVAACAPQRAPADLDQPIIQPALTPTTQPTAITPSPSQPNQSAQPSILPTRTLQPSNESTIPLFDAHLHYSRDAWEEFSVPAILGTLDKAGIRRALVSSTPNEGTLKLYQADPGRIVPEARPYRVSEDQTHWFTEPGIVDYIDSELKRPGIPYRGIGEFHIYGDEPKAPFVKRIVDLAVERNLILHAHSDDAAITNLFALNPRARILWAHAGMTTPIGTIDKMLARYQNLWAELALRSDVSSNGRLDPGWRALFLKYPDRFLYGTDTWIPSRWDDVAPDASIARSWLAELPRDVAEKIAEKNFETLYGK